MVSKRGNRILVLAIRAIGDMALITPVIRHLKQTFPDSRLVVLADGVSAQVLEHNPHLDRIIAIDRARSKRLSGVRRVKEWWNVVETVRRERFDIVVDLFSGPRSALLGWLSGARERYGEACQHRIRGFLYNRPIPAVRDGRHLVEQKLDLIHPLVGHVNREAASLELFLISKECERGKILLESVAQRDVPIVGLVPNAGSQWRVWPANRFAELADRLVKKYDSRIVLLGGPQDQDACRIIEERMNSKPLNLAGKTTLRELMAVLDRLDFVVANVTGPMHLAVALHSPKVIALYGAADIVQYAPWGTTATMVTKARPDEAYWQNVDYERDYEYLLKISVDDVLEHIQFCLREPVS